MFEREATPDTTPTAFVDSGPERETARPRVATIGRMLELPHGHGIAAEMLRELAPYLEELTALSACEASGGVKSILVFAEGLKTRLNGSDSRELKGGRQSLPARVA